MGQGRFNNWTLTPMLQNDYSRFHHNFASPKAKEFVRAIARQDLTRAITILEQGGYTDELTQLFLLSWLTPDPMTGGGSDA